MDSEVSRLRKKVENYPSPSAYNRLAELLRLNGDSAEAESVCQRCIREFPRNGQAYVIMATIELGAGRRDEAKRQLKHAVNSDPRCYSGFRMLSDLYVEEGRKERAIDMLQRILAFKPDDRAVNDRIAELQAGGDAQSQDEDTDTIDLSNMGSLATASSGVIRSPFAEERKPAAGNRAMDGSGGSPLAALCQESGVRGAIIADDQGRAVAESGLPEPQGDLLAAHARDITANASAALATSGSGGLTSWSIQASNGQILGYHRQLAVVAVADPKVKAALLELRARQALIDMGAA